MCGPLLLRPLAIFLSMRSLEAPSRRRGREPSVEVEAKKVQARLADLEHPRARRLAAAVIARALPVLTDRAQGVEPWARHDILMALDKALDAVEQVDIHARYLMARPRSRLAVELDAAKRQVERGQPGAHERLRELEAEREELLAASVAHDLGTRKALESCAHIMETTREMALITPHRALEAPAQPSMWQRLMPALLGG